MGVDDSRAAIVAVLGHLIAGIAGAPDMQVGVITGPHVACAEGRAASDAVRAVALGMYRAASVAVAAPFGQRHKLWVSWRFNRNSPVPACGESPPSPRPI